MDRLSNCELEIMKILWDNEGGVSPGEMKQKLKERKGRDYEKSTIGTWLQRLKKKNLVASVRAEKGVRYVSLMNQEEYERMEVELLTERLFRGKFPRVFATFAKTERLTESDIEEMREIMDGYRR